MYYDTELNFLCSLMKNLHLPVNIIEYPTSEPPELDFGLRRMLYKEPDYQKTLALFEEPLKENTVFRIKDEYLCNYLLFALPETTPSKYLVIGPFTYTEITEQMVLKLAEKLSLSPRQFSQFHRYYSDLPLHSDENTLFAIISTFCEKLYGSIESFSVETIERRLSDNIEPVASRPDFQEPEEAFLSMHRLEDRYAQENNMIHAVSQGLVQKAEMMMGNTNILRMEKRSADPIRSLKNYTIILNTLLRKGAEAGSVHPLHIDSLSSRFARQIEQISTLENAVALQKEMVHKYCLLVKNHSMKGYSLLIQKVLVRIDSDLTADLSLKTQAALLNVNASYLSTLFKKETGQTLTDYVNKKRVEHALFLLNSSSMQIQTIAQYCGIPDVNYFTKIFKKYVGKTPKEYRDGIS